MATTEGQDQRQDEGQGIIRGGALASGAIVASANLAEMNDLVSRYHGADIQIVKQPDDGTTVLAILPKDKRVEDLTLMLTENQARPSRRSGHANIVDVDSLVTLALRFASPSSAVFASPDRQQPSISVVFDYHPKGSEATSADWLQHRAVYKPALSEEWKAWSAKNGQLMAQAEFAQFIEDRVGDLIVPDFDDPKLKTFADLVGGRFASPSDLIGLSRGLQVNVETVVRNAVTTSTGEVSVLYDEQHRDGAGAPIQIANLFTICIPVFYAGELYRMAVRLRYRVANGRINWGFQLYRPDLVFDSAFKGIVEKVKTDTLLPLFLGTPEA